MEIDTFLEKLDEYNIQFELKGEEIRDSSGYCPIACLWLEKNKDNRWEDPEFANFHAVSMAEDMGLSMKDAQKIIFSADHHIDVNSEYFIGKENNLRDKLLSRVRNKQGSTTIEKVS